MVTTTNTCDLFFLTNDCLVVASFSNSAVHTVCKAFPYFFLLDANNDLICMHAIGLIITCNCTLAQLEGFPAQRLKDIYETVYGN